MRRIQPQGPYLLAGWSSGAITAYEMARQIESTGTTAHVTMFDPPPPPDGKLEAVGDTALLLAFAALGEPSRDQRASIREMIEGLDVESALLRLLELARATGGLPAEVDIAWFRDRYHLFCRATATMETYLPRPTGCPITLYRADASLPRGTTDLLLGWDRLARTEALLIPHSDHASLLERPALDLLVDHLEPILAAFEDEPAPGLGALRASPSLR